MSIGPWSYMCGKRRVATGKSERWKTSGKLEKGRGANKRNGKGQMRNGKGWFR